MPPGGGVSGGFLPGWIYEPLQDLARVVSLFGYLIYVFLRLSMNQQNEDVLAFLHQDSHAIMPQLAACSPMQKGFVGSCLAAF